MALLVLLLLSPLLIVTLVFAVELFLGLAPLECCQTNDSFQVKTTVVIPAHNEERAIGRTLSSVGAARGDLATNVLVIADNCDDETAVQARSSGARVIERQDPRLHGKGYALEYAKMDLAASPPDVIIVLDADCTIDRMSLQSLAAAAHTQQLPFQAINLLIAGASHSPLVRISSFAFMVKNVIRQRALQRLAGRVHLTGTGMAFPWPLFRDVNLATADIVEDLSMGLELSARRRPPKLLETALVTSPSATPAGTLSQRQRWEGGFLQVAAAIAPRALLKGLRRRNLRDIFAALDLFVPPVALLTIVNLVVVGCMAVASGTGVLAAWPTVLYASVFAAALGGIVLAWLLEGRQILSIWDLLLAPFYVLWKLPHYFRLLVGGAPKEWVRGER